MSSDIHVKVNEIKQTMLKVCEQISELNKVGIRVEFNMVDGKLVSFRAFQEMKISQ
jgi:hypothetical protein